MLSWVCPFLLAENSSEKNLWWLYLCSVPACVPCRAKGSLWKQRTASSATSRWVKHQEQTGAELCPWGSKIRAVGEDCTVGAQPSTSGAPGIVEWGIFEVILGEKRRFGHTACSDSTLVTQFSLRTWTSWRQAVKRSRKRRKK